MVMNELIPAVREMSRTDKWSLMEFLVTELAQQDDDALLEELRLSGKTFQIWPPQASIGAADALFAALKAEEHNA